MNKPLFMILCLFLLVINLSIVSAKNCGGYFPCDCGDTVMADPVIDYDISGCGDVGLYIGADNLVLDCDGHFISGLDSGIGIIISDKQGITVKNCEIKYFSNGVYVENGTNIEFSDNYLNNNLNGLYFNTSNQNEITTTDFLYNDKGIVFSEQSNNNSFHDNFLKFNEEAGLKIVNSDSNDITDVEFTQNQHGIYIESGTQNNFWNNKFKINTISAFEELGVINNNWYLGETGNLWRDYEDNPGYPTYYEIHGDGDGIDPYASLLNLECGDTIIEDTILTKDIIDCAGNGLVIGANDITLDCDGKEIRGLNAFYGVFSEDKEQITVKNCNIGGFCRGIHFVNTPKNNIIDNTISFSTARGISLGDSPNSMISGNNLMGNQYAGILLYGSQGTTIDNNVIDGLKDTNPLPVSFGIRMENSPYCKIRDNSIFNHDDSGIYMKAYSTNATITGNDIYENDQTNIYMVDASGSNVSYNNITDGEYFGLYVVASEDCIITNNFVSSNWREGITLGYFANNNYIANNEIVDSTVLTGMGGLVIQSDCSYNEVINNTIERNSVGFYLGGDHNIIRGNKIGLSTGSHVSHGVVISGEDASFNEFDKNEIYLNNGWGVYLDWGHDNLFYNNIFRNAPYEGGSPSGVYNNKWNKSNVGNYYKFYQYNEGYPNAFFINGPRDGVDYYPRGPYSVEANFFSEYEDTEGNTYDHLMGGGTCNQETGCSGDDTEDARYCPVNYCVYEGLCYEGNGSVILDIDGNDKHEAICVGNTWWDLDSGGDGPTPLPGMEVCELAGYEWTTAESSSVGEYEWSYNGYGCCGDDAGEFYSGGICYSSKQLPQIKKKTSV